MNFSIQQSIQRLFQIDLQIEFFAHQTKQKATQKKGDEPHLVPVRMVEIRYLSTIDEVFLLLSKPIQGIKFFFR